MTDSHELLPRDGTVRALAAVVGGSLVVRVLVFRPAPMTPVSRFSGSVFLRPSCGGAFWFLLRLEEDWTGSHVYAADSPDLLPGDAFHLAAVRLDEKLAVPYESAPARAPLSPEELALVASLPSVLQGMVPALLVMLS